MPVGLDPVSMAAQGVGGLISTVSGLFQRGRANRLARNNKRPLYEIPQEVQNNQYLAQQMATEGLSGSQYAKGVQNIGRGANNALSGAQNRRGGLAAIGAIQQNSNDASMNLDMADHNARLNNIRNLMQQNSMMAQYRDKQFAWNKQGKYEENAAAIQALNGAASANINNGINMLMGAGITGSQMMGGAGSGTGTTGLTPQQMMQNADMLDGGFGRTNWNNNALPYNDFRIPR